MLSSVVLRCWAVVWAIGFLMMLPASAAPTDAELAIGFSGTVKIGHWAPVTLCVPTETAGLDAAATLKISAIDGDESPVTYCVAAHEMASADRHTRNFQGLCRLGRRFGRLWAELVDSDGNVLARGSTSLEAGPLDCVSSTDHLSLVLSANDRFYSDLAQTLGASLNEPFSGNDQHAIQVPSFELLPLDELGWQSVNQVVLSCASASSIGSLSPQQWTALRRWIGGGGHLLLITDPTQPTLLDQTPFKKLLPPIASTQTMSSSRSLERFVGASRVRLVKQGEPGLDFTSFGALKPGTAVTLATAEQSPLVFGMPLGFGKITVVAFDLESARLSQWPSYTALLEKVLGESGEGRSGAANQRREAKRVGAAVSHYGYDDMSGQLRVPLDDFSTVRFLDFTLIALLIGLYILCISLGDYFFLKRFAKKMELTWITFPLISLTFCGVAWGLAAYTRPNRLQINQMEIIDITPGEDYSRGTSWMNIYSPTGQKIDITMEPQTSLGLDVIQSAVTWLGLPGDGLGGMETKTTTGFGKTGYLQQLTPAQTLNASTHSPEAFNATMEQLPLQVSSTRSLISNFRIASPPVVSSQLAVRRDRLQGTFENPLEVPVFNAKIFFGNYVYLLKETLQPGDVVFMETGADEKTIKTYLNRRTTQSSQGRDAGKTQTLPWNPRDKSLTRIADVMMFFKAAGGKNYTGLSHGYFPQIDATNLLEMNQAVLVGQLQSGSQLKINGNPTQELYDSSVTLVRIVLPVENQ